MQISRFVPHNTSHPAQAEKSKAAVLQKRIVVALYRKLLSVLIRFANLTFFQKIPIGFTVKKKLARFFSDIKADQKRATRKCSRDLKPSSCHVSSRLLLSLNTGKTARLSGCRFGSYSAGRLYGAESPESLCLSSFFLTCVSFILGNCFLHWMHLVFICAVYGAS